MRPMFVGGWRGPGSSRQILRPHSANPELREDHLRGSRRLSGLGSPFHDSGGAGLAHCSWDERGQRGSQRLRLPAIVLAIGVSAAGVLCGCRTAAPPDPVAIFQQIRTDSLHGSLDVARQEAEKARQEFSPRDPDWAMKFRLLAAEILVYQGRRPEVIALLAAPGVAYPGGGDSAIKRNFLRALAHARLGQPQQADQELQQALRLSETTHSALNGEVLRTEATLQEYRGHWAEAGEFSRQSLRVARHQRDSFLEATDLLNLGYEALKQEHYDEAVGLLNEAADLAK